MPKIAYVHKNFSAEHLAIIERADTLCRSYAAQGYDLTLRQLYYQFVARAWIKNSLQEYKRLGGIINDARLAGLVDWDHIVDRTRNLAHNSHWNDPSGVIASAAYGYGIDLWANQPIRAEVWVEKEALVGVVERICRQQDVAFFACRGYTSQSELWSAAMRLCRYVRNGQLVRIFHLGDHDPSGIDMTRDITERLDIFAESTLGYSSARNISVKRLALNMDQVDQYNPPPNPAKSTDSRFESYLREYGDESWELDALEPQVINDLIATNVASVRDKELWREKVSEQERGRALLTSVSAHWDDVATFTELEMEDSSESIEEIARDKIAALLDEKDGGL